MPPRMPLETIVSPLPGPRSILAAAGVPYAVAAMVAFLFAASGPVAIILAVGARGGLAESDIASWIFAAFCLNSVISIAFTLAYRQPLIFLWSIPGAVLGGPALGHLSFPEVVGAFLVTGVLMLLLGLSGWVRRAMEAVPMPIVMAMVAGVFLRFGVDLVLAFRDHLWIALPMTAAFALLSAVPGLARVLPPLVGALIAGGLAVGVLGAFKPPATALLALAAPNLYLPQFSWAAMVELVVPLAVTVLAVQNAQGVAILAANGHQAPVNAITAACGVGSVVTGLFGAVSTCLTGPVSAVLSSAGETHRQYVGALFFCLFAAAFGVLATLAGLAMLRVLQTAFTASFGGRFSFGALICFLVTVADVPILQIGAPFWGLVFGLAVSWLLEHRAP